MDNKENNSPISGERVPQVKSVEDEIAILVRETEPIKQFVWKWLHDKGFCTDDICMDSLEFQDVFEVMRVYSQFRIAELEASNAKYREALENIANATDGNNPGHAVFYFEARNALTLKQEVPDE